MLWQGWDMGPGTVARLPHPSEGLVPPGPERAISPPGADGDRASLRREGGGPAHGTLPGMGGMRDAAAGEGGVAQGGGRGRANPPGPAPVTEPGKGTSRPQRAGRVAPAISSVISSGFARAMGYR